MENGTVKCSANYVPLSPISFLERSSIVYANRASIVYGNLKFTWKQTHQRCLQLASALANIGISRGDVVAALAPNIPATYELHFAVPMAGAVLCTLNVHHNSAMVSVLLRHSEAKVIFVDYQFLNTAKGALKILSDEGLKIPHLILIPECSGPNNISNPEALEYDSFLATGQTDFVILRPKDEWDPISLNYISGTTSSPKGVIYSHRGAYLNSLSAILLNEMLSMPVYLWAVPMFHCNGWCLTWAVAAQGGTNVCLRNVTAGGIFECISANGVTHMGGAPTVLNMIINAPASEKCLLPGKVSVMTGGAPPPDQVLFKMEELGFNVTHSYGLTETYGPGTVCTWKPEWDPLPPNARAKIKARQGLQHLGMEEVDVKDPSTMQTVPADAKTMGEVMFRGNTVMNGYFKDEKATQDAFKGGWFRTGDIAVKHPDGYIELKDRSKDIIISGGENISTIEVESVIFSHPAVLEAAVVGRPDHHWGETPCAFVKLKDGCDASADDIIKYCRDRLPHYMAPQTVIFEDLPKTSTGKTQKFVLRSKAKALGAEMDAEYLQWCKENKPQKYKEYMQAYYNNTIFPPHPNPQTSVVRPLFEKPYIQNYQSPSSQTPMFSQTPEVEEVVHETQPEKQPIRRRGKAKATGGAATNTTTSRNNPYNESEDIGLISAYMEVSRNVIVGTDQKYGKLFRLVAEKYEDIKRAGMMTGMDKFRSHDSLRGRWGRLRDDINHWMICVERATVMVDNRSSYSEEDVRNTAQKLYREKSKNHNSFAAFKQWDAMKAYPEWELKMNLQEIMKKFVPNGEDGVEGDDVDVGDQPMETASAGGSSGSKRNRGYDSAASIKHPIGREKYKKLAKNATSGNSSMDDFGEGITGFSENYPQILEVEKQKLELARGNMERKSKAKMMDTYLALVRNYANLPDEAKAHVDALGKQLFGSG